MFTNTLRIGIVCSVAMLLAACNEPSKSEVLAKVEGKSTPTEIETALGKPSNIIDDGVLKLWQYETSDGPVCFSMVGRLAMRMQCY